MSKKKREYIHFIEDMGREMGRARNHTFLILNGNRGKGEDAGRLTGQATSSRLHSLNHAEKNREYRKMESGVHL